MVATFSQAELALVALLEWLSTENYRFTTPTPMTHQRMWSRRLGETAENLRDIFGWNLPFTNTALPPTILSLLKQSGALLTMKNQHRSAVRVSSINERLFLHSAFPTDAENAVFFGPDTYRFVNFIHQQLSQSEAKTELRILDVGCGSGAGGLMAAQLSPQATLTLSDINATVPLMLTVRSILRHWC